MGWYLDPKCRLQRCEPLDYCGDGALNGPEKCDPNDLSSGQYCLANCQLGPYPGDNVCTAIDLGTVPPHEDCDAVCGDGRVTPPETCEPGLDPNMPCDGPGGIAPCGIGNPSCGDGFLNQAGEQCDDGNMNAGDGCSPGCMLEAGCNDGVKAPTEECDDAIDPLCKGCQLPRRVFVTSDQYTPGVHFSSITEAENFCKTLGTGKLGSTSNTWMVWMSESASATAPVNRVPRSNTKFGGKYLLLGAGDVVVAEGWAGLTSGMLVNPINRTETGAVVMNGLRAWTNTTAQGTSAGANDCVKWTDQDAPLGVHGDVASKTSTWSEVFPPSLLCAVSNRFYCIEVSRCGDGSVQGDEECDDGNDVETDACLGTCRNAKCGDGFVRQGVEECDDGNASSLDACSPTCKLTGCGDGFIQDGEECDDGNQSNTDGCLNTCKKATCGDGVVWAKWEYCDDGNDVETDACRNDCTSAGCGDGVVWAGMEDCDDGNDVDTDACRNKCIAATCGDKVVWAGMEDCDDGNDNDNDACTNQCKNG